MTPTHIDIVSNEWSAGYQHRLGRIVIEAPSPRTNPGRWLEIIAENWKGNSYVFFTDAHDEESCPFREADTLPMERLPVDGKYQLPRIEDGDYERQPVRNDENEERGLTMAKKQPKFDEVLDGVRVRVYATRTDYEVIFGDDDIADPNAEVLCYPKLGPPDGWARQGRLERKGA